MPSATDATAAGKPSLAVLGANGNLGGDLVTFLADDFVVTGITRENYAEHRGKHFDVFVNANGNSRRFWANQHPREDFEASTVSVLNSLTDFSHGRYLYASSSDVYPNHGDPAVAREDAAIDPTELSPYGFHKFLAELLVKKYAKQWVIFRSSMILGEHLKKGAIYDIVNHKPLFVTLDSRIQLITTKAFADAVKMAAAGTLDHAVWNVGGKGAFAFRDAAAYFPGPIAIDPVAETQEYEMNVEKLARSFPLKTSEVYLQEFLHGNH